MKSFLILCGQILLKNHVRKGFTMKNLTFLIISFALSLSVSYAGKISYSLSRLDGKSDERETPFNSQSSCGMVGTHLRVAYKETLPDNTHKKLWVADIRFIPEEVLAKESASKVNVVPSVVTATYFLYGGNTPQDQQQAYNNYYRKVHNFTNNLNGIFQYTYLGQLSFSEKLAANTELFRWERDDPQNNFSIQNLHDIILTFRTVDKKGKYIFPKYCARGWKILPTCSIRGHEIISGEEVLNCITFSMRFLQKSGIPLNQDPFIGQYLQNTLDFLHIAYPERFLEPLAKVCKINGGWVNRKNISAHYNNFYYETKSLRKILEPEKQNPPIQEDQKADAVLPDGNTLFKRRYGGMWIVGDVDEDRRAPVNTSTLLGVGGGAVVAGGVAAFLAAPVLLPIAGGAIVGGAGIWTAKKIMGWF